MIILGRGRHPRKEPQVTNLKPAAQAIAAELRDLNYQLDNYWDLMGKAARDAKLARIEELKNKK